MNTATQILTAPNTEYLEFNFCKETATGRGLNEQFVMENLHDGTFKVTDGRVGITIGRYKPKTFIRPMVEWDSTYSNRIARGYLLTKTQKMEKKTYTKNSMSVNGETFKPMESGVAEIIERLLSFANQVIDTNFTVKVEDISDEMLAYGKKILNDLANDFSRMSVAEFNNKLKVLYAAIPRRIDNLSKNLANRKVDFNDIVANEMDLYDIMLGQLRSSNVEKNADQTILDTFGIEMHPVTEEESKYVKEMLGSVAPKYINAWRVVNNKTEKRFNEFCKQETLTEEKGIHHLFHGSRNENFWSIITNGLTINPCNVVITGKMFGNGTYFAPKAAKAMGYTSRYGSKWACGSSNSGFLAIYKVATGTPYRLENAQTDLTYAKLQQRCKGAHCTWGYAGTSLREDEVIVYKDEQSTIEYLIEIGI